MKYIINTIPRGRIPAGYVIQYPENDRAPLGWLDCDGRVVSQREYPFLFEVIKTSFNHIYVVQNERMWFQFWKPKYKIVVENIPGLFRIPNEKVGNLYDIKKNS